MCHLHHNSFIGCPHEQGCAVAVRKIAAAHIHAAAFSPVDAPVHGFSMGENAPGRGGEGRLGPVLLLVPATLPGAPGASQGWNSGDSGTWSLADSQSMTVVGQAYVSVSVCCHHMLCPVFFSGMDFSDTRISWFQKNPLHC